jgi:hypothetical protein
MVGGGVGRVASAIPRDTHDGGGGGASPTGKTRSVGRHAGRSAVPSSSVGRRRMRASWARGDGKTSSRPEGRPRVRAGGAEGLEDEVATLRDEAAAAF